jgi:thioesterase domain-containing protein
VTTREFLLGLRRLGVEIWLEGDRVRCSAPTGVLTVERRAELARRRPEIETVLRAAHAAAAATVVPIEARGSRLPFYAVPGHNGDVFCFVRLARCLGPDQPFYGLQPPGYDGDAPALRRIEDLAAFFVGEIVRHQPDGPYQLGGYCLGGLTAFEMARQLRAAGREVRALVLFGTTSPPALRPLNRARATLAYGVETRLRSVRAFLSSPSRERVRQVEERLRRLARFAKRTAAEPPDELTERRLRVQSATLAAAYSYAPEPYDGQITMFAPNDAATRSFDRPLEWAAYAHGGFDVFCGPADCDGDSMLKNGSASVFAEQLARRLDAPARRAVVARA